MPGGERARALIVHDMRDPTGSDRGPLPSQRRGGDDLLGPAEGTAEKGIASLVTQWMASMDAMAGEDTSMLGNIAGFIEGAA